MTKKVISSANQKIIKKDREERYDLFASAGLWKNRDIDPKQLRKEAWKKSKDNL